MKRKRVLIIANVNSIFTYSFVKKMLEADMELFIIDRAMEKSNEEYYKFCEENNVHVKSLFHEGGYERCLRYAEWIFSMGYFDVCHIMYFSITESVLVKLCERQFGRIIVNYWGSDFILATPEIERHQKMVLDIADQIIVPVEDMKEKVLEKYPFLSDRVSVVKFRTPIMSELLCDKNISENAGGDISLNHDKTIVMCGYAGSPEQQHSLMIHAINNSSKEVREKIFVVFMMTYGLTEDYKNYVTEELKNASFEYVILTEYLSDKQIVYLRRNTDVFVYAELTDAYSATLQENLYCGAVCLIGSWLGYKNLEEKNLSMWRFDREDNLTSEFENIILNLPEYKQKAGNNSKIMRRIWNEAPDMENWANYYDGKNSEHEQADTIKLLSYIQQYVKGQEQAYHQRAELYQEILHIWLEKQMKNIKPVCEYVERKNYKNILIYGAGTLGKLAYSELKSIAEIRIDVCDRDAKQEETEWLKSELIRPNQLSTQEVREYDCILITPIHLYEQIKKDLGNLSDSCVSLYDIITKLTLS